MSGLRTHDAQAPMIELRDIHKHFGPHHVLKGLDLEVARGEVVALMGPSGSGKSTFLRCINRIEEPSSGVVRIDGTRINEARVNIDEVRADIGMVFQEYNLFPHLTAVQNVTLGLVHVRGLGRAEADERARVALEGVGLAEHADKRPPSLSGGQQQRVAIARSLAMRPKVLLFDEPTSALDPEMVHEVLDVMRELAREGMTMVVVSHELGFLREAGHRVVMMDDGRIVEVGPPGQVLGEPEHPRTRAFLRAIR